MSDVFEDARLLAEQAGMDWAASQSPDMDVRIVLTVQELKKLLDGEWVAGSNNCPGWAHSSVESFAESTLVRKARKAFLDSMDGTWQPE